MSNTLLGGPLPAWIGELTSLNDIILSRCRLTSSIPSSISKLHRLEIFDIGDNALTGALPDMRHFPKISEVYYEKNFFSGLIPYNFSSSLRRLDLSRNMLAGSISPHLFRIPSLELFGVSLNCLSEELPESICQATRLQYLYLDGLGGSDLWYKLNNITFLLY